MPYHRKLIGKKCYLSPLSEEDGELWAEWLNDLDVALPLGDEAFQILGTEKCSEMARTSQSRGDTIFTIVDSDTDKPIGRTILFSINQVYANCMFGIFIGDKNYWSRGYGTEATLLILDYAFNLLNLHNVSLGVFEFNKRAQVCYKKAGFKEIGRRREAITVGNKKYDAILMDILSTEFESPYVMKVLQELED